MLTGVILAGGQSRRMGTDKLALEFNGRTLLQRTADLLEESGAGQILISGDCNLSVSQDNCRIPDIDKPELGGPPRGLYSVLKWLSSNGMLDGRSLIVLTGDMPLLNATVIQRLVAASADSRAVRFRSEVFPFILCADRTTLDLIEAELAEGSEMHDQGNGKGVISMQYLLKLWQAGEVDTDGLSDKVFTNVNTPEEWQKIR